MSRTSRGMRSKSTRIGCMRVFMMFSCSSVVTRSRLCSTDFTPACVERLEQLAHLVAAEHELAGQVHQLVEQRERDADRVGAALAAGRVELGLGHSGERRGCARSSSLERVRRQLGVGQALRLRGRDRLRLVERTGAERDAVSLNERRRSELRCARSTSRRCASLRKPRSTAIWPK